MLLPEIVGVILLRDIKPVLVEDVVVDRRRLLDVSKAIKNQHVSIK